jgi:predicted transcriptional regulator
VPARKDPDAPLQANLYVVGRFLDRLAEPGRSWTKASLQAACGVNYDIFRRYLELLEGKGYLAVTKTTIRLTREGSAIRAQLQGLLSEFLARPPGGGRDAPSPKGEAVSVPGDPS